MIPLRNERRRHWFTVSLAILLSLSGLLATAKAQSAPGGVGGTIRLIVRDQTVLLVGAKVVVSNVAPNSGRHQAVTDNAGQYRVDLPEGSYTIHFSGRDGDCSIVRRAPLRLNAGEHLTFDFLTMHCPNNDSKLGSEVPYEEENNAGFKSMNVPFASQGRRYLEQLIPGEPGHWPEIIVSFGKYDNQADEIRYFPMYQAVMKDAPAASAPLALSLPVAVTVDRYILQALEVVLDKKTMVFTAKGHVFISDGQSGKMGNRATLSFSAGQPKLKMEH